MSSSHSTLAVRWLSAQQFVTLQGMPEWTVCVPRLTI